MQVQCERCGFVTSLVYEDGEYRRDFKTHGNKASTATCFNCDAPLNVMPPKAEPVSRTEDDESVELIDHSTLDMKAIKKDTEELLSELETKPKVKRKKAKRKL